MSAEANPLPLRAEEGCHLSSRVQAALRQCHYMYDVYNTGRLDVDDLSCPFAAPFVHLAGIDLGPRGAPLGAGKVLKLSDFAEGLSYETLEGRLLKAWGASSDKWMRLFEGCGFDAQLCPHTSSMAFVLTMHTTSEHVALRHGDVPASLYDTALSSFIKAHGKRLTVKSMIAVYQLGTANGAAFAGEVLGAFSAEATIDMSGLNNMAATTKGGLKHSQVLTPGADVAFLVGLSQDDPMQAYKWRYKCAARKAAAGAPAPTGPRHTLASQFRRLAADLLQAEATLAEQTKAAIILQKVARGRAERQNVRDGEASGVVEGVAGKQLVSPRAMTTLPDAVRLPPPTKADLAYENASTKVQAAVRGKQARTKPVAPPAKPTGFLGSLLGPGLGVGLGGIRPIDEKVDNLLRPSMPSGPTPGPMPGAAPGGAPTHTPPIAPGPAGMRPYEETLAATDVRGGLQSMEERLAARTDAMLHSVGELTPAEREAQREEEMRAREEAVARREEELAEAKRHLDEVKKRKAAKEDAPMLPCSRSEQDGKLECVLL